MTERKRTEERLRDMFEHARDAIYTSDLEGRFTSANLAAERLTGYSREELLQMRVRRPDRSRGRRSRPRT